MRSLNLFLPAFVAALLLPASSGQTTALIDVTVIDPGRRVVEPHRTVLLQGSRITAVQASSVAVPSGARRIEGAGKFLIPGLWDAHVHLTKAGGLSLPLFLVNGITSVRDMGSDPDEVLRWKAEVEAGSRLGPHIKTCGRILESKANVDRMKREGTVEPVDRIRMPIATPEQGRAAVRQAAARGLDHVKMRTTPDLQTFQAVAAEALRLKLPFAAHPVARPEELIRSGLRSVEHFLAYPPLDNLDVQARKALFERVAKAGMLFSNTMANIEGSILLPYAAAKARIDDVSGKVDPNRKDICGYLVKDWREQIEENKNEDMGSFRAQLPSIYRDFRGMHESGVQFLAGTDVGVAFMYPGVSLHDELKQLAQELHIPSMDVLRIATRNPLAFYGADASTPAIAAGQPADLVLLDADPIRDITNTRRIAGVFFKGRWSARTDLDRVLKEVERRATSNCDAGPVRLP